MTDTVCTESEQEIGSVEIGDLADLPYAETFDRRGSSKIRSIIGCIHSYVFGFEAIKNTKPHVVTIAKESFVDLVTAFGSDDLCVSGIPLRVIPG